ncbi:hypothetical protein [Moritella sp. F3]|uniref:hypothetical protein n=1 Tax=Moritella sp. F3 TaxID=2718882 RepID=UPI0018E14929|nr:hypothetical protein [Moritella sp. F3]GIC77690.1 hypothetical protein FMO001_24170 [Moritella sp. F1]GIC82103.1 hypothetical protein FMO003_23840 [Moritella sp. F3]
MEIISNNKQEDIKRWKYVVSDAIQSERLSSFSEEGVRAYGIESAFCIYEKKVVGRLCDIISKTTTRFGIDRISDDIRDQFEKSLLDFFCFLIDSYYKEGVDISEFKMEIYNGTVFDVYLDRLDQSFHGHFYKGRLLVGLYNLEDTKSISIK